MKEVIARIFYKLIEPIRQKFGIRKEFFDVYSNKKILDIACGNYKRGSIGLDIINTDKVDIVANALEIHLVNESVDEVISYHFIEHLTPCELKIFVKEVNRVLRINGKAHFLIDRDLSEKKLMDKDDTHKKRYNKKEIKKIFSRYFEIQILQSWNLIGNLRKYKINFLKYLKKGTKIYIQVNKKND
jgi:predicted SAM-dependent methyltransferase